MLHTGYIPQSTIAMSTVLGFAQIYRQTTSATDDGEQVVRGRRGLVYQYSEERLASLVEAGSESNWQRVSRTLLAAGCALVEDRQTGGVVSFDGGDVTAGRAVLAAIETMPGVQYSVALPTRQLPRAFRMLFPGWRADHLGAGDSMAANSAAWQASLNSLIDRPSVYRSRRHKLGRHFAIGARP